MTTATAPNKVLLAAPKAPKPPAAELLVRVAREHGVSPFRQLREMFTLRYGVGKVGFDEYVSTGVFRPEHHAATKAEFVGRLGSMALNLAASPEKITKVRSFLGDKLVYAELLRGLGVPATETQALVHDERTLGQKPVLRTPSELIAFMCNEARYPIFGKPVQGSGSVGSVLITSIDAKRGMMQLGNGREMDLDAFAHEVVADYPDGFLLQTAIQQHEAMANVTGAAVGTLRIVTLRDHNGVAPLYHLWKIPSPKAMSDNYWQDGSMIAEIGPDGRIIRCAKGSGLDHAWIERHPVSDVTLPGYQIPHWDKVLELASHTHALFPEFGVIGWDIGMGTDGPIIIEANTNPQHVLYQQATGRGARNAQLLPRFEAAAAESERKKKIKLDLILTRLNDKKS